MADVAVENKDTPVVEKVGAEEVIAKKVADVAEETPATENGAATITDAKTNENGASNAASEPTVDVTPVVEAAEKSKAESAIPAESATEENGDKESADAAEEGNGDSTDSVPAETVKRKVEAEADAKSETAATPEKKAKLDEAVKEDVQNGSEATEVAA